MMNIFTCEYSWFVNLYNIILYLSVLLHCGIIFIYLKYRL
jgi:hypothetical protein